MPACADTPVSGVWASGFTSERWWPVVARGEGRADFLRTACGLAALGDERWEAWRGVGGLLYARLRRSSPPVVFRDVTGEGLARQIREWEREHR